MKPESLLILGGRAPVALELSRLFSLRGYDVWHAESLPFPLTRFSASCSRFVRIPSPAYAPEAFAKALEDLLKKNRFRMVIPTCEEVFYLARYRDRFAHLTEIFTDEFSKLTVLHNKMLFIEKAASFGFRVPLSRLAESVEQMRLEKTKMDRVVLKPVWSRFGEQVIICPGDKDPLPANCSKSNPWVVQEFIEGDLWCSWSVFQQGKLLAHTSYPGKFLAGRASIQFYHGDHSQILAWVREFGEKFLCHGQVSFDFMVTKNQEVIPLECNPRATSGIHNFKDNRFLPDCFLSGNHPSLPLFPRSGKKTALKLAMLLYCRQGLRVSGSLRNFVKEFISGRDVIFDFRDPLPSAGQLISFLMFSFLAIKKQKTLLDAMVSDIAFCGEVDEMKNLRTEQNCQHSPSDAGTL